MTSGEHKETMGKIDAMGQALMTLEDYYDKMTRAALIKGMHKNREQHDHICNIAIDGASASEDRHNRINKMMNSVANKKDRRAGGQLHPRLATCKGRVN